MRQLLSGLLSILLVLPMPVLAADAPTPDGVVVSAAPSGLGWSPNEAAPGSYGHIPGEIKTIMAKIAAMPARVSASGGQLTMPSFPAGQKAAATYVAQRPVCFADQARASMICREETSPNLQTTLQGVNLVMSGINSLAVNDACKGFSKAMSVAQAGITAYTAACGLLRKKCNMSCTSAGTGFKALAKYVVTPDETCTGGTPSGMAECSAALAEIKTLKGQMDQMLSQDGSQSVEGTLHNKANLCQHTYGMLLASAGASILSLANSVKQGQQCDEESDATGTSGTTTATSPSTTTDSGTTAPVNTISNPELSAAQTGANTTLDGGNNTGTAGTTDPVYSTPTTPVTSDGSGSGNGSTTPSRSAASAGTGGSASGLGSDTSSSEMGKPRAMGIADESESASGSSEMAGGSSGKASPSFASSDGSSEFANSQYREYLPGGDKDPSRSVAGQEAWRKEVTGAGGKSNWTKMQERYKAVKTLNDD